MFKVLCLVLIAFAVIENYSVDGKKTEIKKKCEGKQQLCILPAGIRRNRKGSGSGMSLTIVEGIQEKPRGCRGQSCQKPKRSCKCPKPKPCVRTFEYDYTDYKRFLSTYILMILFWTHRFLPFTGLSKLRWWHEWGNKCSCIERINECVFFD